LGNAIKAIGDRRDTLALAISARLWTRERTIHDKILELQYHTRWNELKKIVNTLIVSLQASSTAADMAAADAAAAFPVAAVAAAAPQHASRSSSTSISPGHHVPGGDVCTPGEPKQRATRHIQASETI
jgi:hypothetical protein